MVGLVRTALQRPLTFVVMRKRNGVLVHPGDGTRIAEVNTPEFDDMQVTPGDTVGYAVLSKRGAVESIAAISLGPFVFLADVKTEKNAMNEVYGRFFPKEAPARSAFGVQFPDTATRVEIELVAWVP